MVAIRPGGLLADPSGAAERAFEAALRRAGVLCVTNLEDLLAAAEILARARPVRSEALSIVTNAIAAGRMAADAVLRDGLQLASDIVHVEPDDSARLAALAGSAAAAPGVGGVLVVHAPTGGDDARAIAALAAARDSMTGCRSWSAPWARPRAPSAGAAWPRPAWRCSPRPSRRCAGFLHLVQDRRNRAAARELPHSTVLTVAPDRDAVRGVFATHAPRRAPAPRCRTRRWRCCRAYGIPVVPTRAVASPDDAAEAAALLGFPAVVKLRQSVRPDARAVRRAGARPARRRGGHGGRPSGWPRAADDPSLLVQRQAVRWRELRIQVADDATFGPIISFGQGGTTADIVGDVAADLPPLNLALAHGLIGRTRAAATLARFRDNPPANEPAVAEALVRVSQLIVDFPEIAELDLNPLIVDADGVLAADAWLRLREAGDAGGGLAITPVSGRAGRSTGRRPMASG